MNDAKDRDLKKARFASESSSGMIIDDDEARLQSDDTETSATATDTPTVTATAKTASALLDTMGVSVYHLQKVFLEQEILTATDKWGNALYSKASKINEIEDLEGPPGVIRQRGINIPCPLDGKRGAAYVHCLKGDDHVGQATHMLSYTWGYSIGDVVDTLCHYCESNNLDPKRTYIWICCLCVNQHRVVEKPPNEKSGVIGPYLFGERVKQIGHLLPLMTPWKDSLYLKRIWCIYELFTAHQQHGCKVDIILPPQQEIALHEDLLGDGERCLKELYAALSNTHVETAQASVESDRTSILKQIETTVGYSTLNKRVNELLRSWIRDCIKHLIDNRDKSMDPDYASFCGKIGYVLGKNGEHHLSLSLHKTALSVWENLGNDVMAANSHNSIGGMLLNKGEYHAALQEYQKSLTIQMSVLPSKNHPSIAKSYDNMGVALFALGDYSGSLDKHQKCLEIIIQQHDHGGVVSTREQNANRARCYNNLGNAMKALGDYQGALSMYSKCLALKQDESIFGKHHPSTALTQSNIGIVLYHMGDNTGALQELGKCLATQESVLGIEHPSTVSTCYSIATILFAKGDKEGAMRACRKVFSAH